MRNRGHITDRGNGEARGLQRAQRRFAPRARMVPVPERASSEQHTPETVLEAMKYLNMDSTKSIAALQGFGNVSQYAAIAFVEMLGGTVACVSCWDRHDKKSYTYSKEGGIDPRRFHG